MVKIYDIGINHTSYKIHVNGRRIFMVELKALFSKNKPVLKKDITRLIPDLYFLVAPIFNFL